MPIIPVPPTISGTTFPPKLRSNGTMVSSVSTRRDAWTRVKVTLAGMTTKKVKTTPNRRIAIALKDMAVFSLSILIDETCKNAHVDRNVNGHLFCESKDSSWDRNLLPHLQWCQTAEPCLWAWLRDDNVCPGKRKLCAEDKSHNVCESSWEEVDDGQNGKNSCNPLYGKCVDNEDAQATESRTESTKMSDGSANTRRDKLWLRRLFWVFVDGRVGIFGWEGFEGDGVLWRFDHNERWYQTTESVFNHKHGKQEGNKSRDEHDSSPCWDLDLVTMLSVSIKPTSDERSGNVHFDVLLKERR